MEQVVEELETKAKETDKRMDTLATQVRNIESEIFADGQEIEVGNLLKSVSEVKSNYQNLRKDLMEVQDLQKQLSTSLHVQLRLMQAQFNTLKEKLNQATPSNVDQGSSKNDG
ncbi:unnamed protein product [Callosobruchus maculatus]|uniref:Ska2 N-terminal domain-containing protein n=1 Tax=Callosobruchus maculatus TaxID=64391 RepID=A0A653DSY6_CALMS|nr:unnamed protein product [Callosobruchus maculatus]